MQHPGCRLRHAASDRRVHGVHTIRQLRGDRTERVRPDRRHVDVDLTRCHNRGQAVRAEQDLLHSLSVGHHGEREVGACGRGGGRGRSRGAFSDDKSRCIWVPVPDGYLVVGL
jgi:hypothetical protein